MQLRCKPGILAYVTDADEPALIGLVVEVVKFWGPMNYHFRRWAGLPSWEVRSSTPIWGWEEDGSKVFVTNFLIPDAYLRPILPPDEETEEHEDKELEKLM